MSALVILLVLGQIGPYGSGTRQWLRADADTTVWCSFYLGSKHVGHVTQRITNVKTERTPYSPEHGKTVAFDIQARADRAVCKAR